MRKAEGIIATSHVTSRGDQLSIEALQQLADSVADRYMPVGIEHDPRIPPQGRIQSAEVREREGGEYEVAAILEFFEAEDTVQESVSPDEGREIVAPRLPQSLSISHDWTHRHDEDQEDLQGIANALDGQLKYESKNAVEPISVLTIAGAFVLGGIASGFLGHIGSDAWEAIKAKILNVLSRKNLRKSEQLFTFQAVIEREGHLLEVELVATNPTSKDLDQMINQGLATLDRVVPSFLHNSPELRRLVFEIKGGEVELLFGVRKDCRPVTAKLTVAQILEALDADAP